MNQKMFKLQTVEDFYNSKKEFFSSNSFITFCITVLVGIISNLGLIINQITNPDGILANKYMGYFGWDVATGRWATKYIYALRNNLTLPIHTTILSIVLFSLAIVLIIKIFEIEGRIYSIVMGALLITFPSLTQMMTYYYMSDTFAFSMLFAVLSVYTLVKLRGKVINIFISIILMVISMSTYQAFMGLVIALYMSLVFIRLINGEESVRKIIFDGLKYVLICLISVVTYFIVCTAVCSYYGIELASYRGINTSMDLSISMLPQIIKNSYKLFFDFYTTNQFYQYIVWSVDTIFKVLFVLFVILVVFIIYNMYINRKNEHTEIFLRIIFIVICFIIMPIAYVAIALIAINTSVDFKMLPHMMIPICMVFCVLQNKYINMKSIYQWIAVCLITCISFKNVMISNGVFESMKVRFNQTYSLSTRVVNLIEGFDGYSKDKKLVILGDIMDEQFINNYKVFFDITKTDVSDWGQMWSSSQNQYQYSWYYFLLTYQGFTMNIANEEEVEEVIKSDEFIQMDKFPYSDCIQEINGTIVVKLSDMNL